MQDYQLVTAHISVLVRSYTLVVSKGEAGCPFLPAVRCLKEMDSFLSPSRYLNGGSTYNQP